MRFKLFIIPKPFQSVLIGKTKSGKAVAYPKAGKTAYVNNIRLLVKSSPEYKFLKNELPYKKPLFVSIVFSFVKHKNINKDEKEELESTGYYFRSGSCDLDNLEKPLFDALQGLIYVNDSQIVDKFTKKIYSNENYIDIEII